MIPDDLPPIGVEALAHLTGDPAPWLAELPLRDRLYWLLHQVAAIHAYYFEQDSLGIPRPGTFSADMRTMCWGELQLELGAMIHVLEYLESQ